MLVTATIRDSAGGVIATIDLDDQPSARREKIDDEAPERNLAAEPDAETTAADVLPEQPFGAGERRAVLASAELNDVA